MNNIFSLDSEEILCQGESLNIVCELRYSLEEEDKSICKEYANAISNYINRNKLPKGYKLVVQELAFREESVCYDTFIPGREAADCYDFLEIIIPIVRE